MKKLLTLLSGLTFISTTGLGTIACKQNKIASIDPTTEVDDEKEDKEQKEKEKKELENQEKNFNEKINSYSKANPMILDNENYNDIQADDIIKKLYDDQFADIKNELVITPANFKEITVDETGRWKAHGDLQLTAKFKGYDLTNNKITEQENTIFSVYFITNNLNIKEVELIKENIINLDGDSEKLNVSLLEQRSFFTKILKLLTNVSSVGTLPTVIPTEFNETDPNWKQWNEFIDNLKLNSDFSNLLREDCEGVFSGEQTILEEFTIKYQGKYLDILNALLPNIINFNNFMQQEKDTSNLDNKLLLLGKYLFAKPQSINNDGFLGVNSKIKNKTIKDITNNKDEEFLKFNTNIESLLHNILEGWQNEKGEWSSVSEPLLLETSGSSIESGKVKYNKPWEQSENGVKISYAITELFLIEKIKDSFSNLFMKSLNEDWGITITIPKALFGKTDYHHNFVILDPATVKNLLAKAIFKKLDLINSESISISATFTEKMIFEYLDKTTKQWKKINNINDLGQAIGLRCKVTDIEFEIKSKFNPTIVEKIKKEQAIMFNIDIA